MAKTPAPLRIYANETKKDILPLPNLIKIQRDSYQWFVDEGLKELLKKFLLSKTLPAKSIP